MEKLLFKNNISWLNRHLPSIQKLSLSELLGWPMSEITPLLNGYPPSIDQLIIIHKKLGIRIQDLLETDLSRQINPRLLYAKKNQINLNHHKVKHIQIPMHTRSIKIENRSDERFVEDSFQTNAIKIGVPSGILKNYDLSKLRAFKLAKQGLNFNFLKSDIVIGEQIKQTAFEFKRKRHLIVLNRERTYFRLLFSLV